MSCTVKQPIKAELNIIILSWFRQDDFFIGGSNFMDREFVFQLEAIWS